MRLKSIGLTQAVAIICLNKEGKFIKKYNSIEDASNSLKISHTQIGSVLTGRCNSAKDYLFVEETYYKEGNNYSLKYKKFRSKVLKGKIINKK